MCIRVACTANMVGLVVLALMSVAVHLMRGEYDSRLVWLFNYTHNNDQDHYEKTVNFFDAAADSNGEVLDRVTSGEKELSIYGWDKQQFISHTRVKSSTKTSRYIINNCLKFKNKQNSIVHSMYNMYRFKYILKHYFY